MFILQKQYILITFFTFFFSDLSLVRSILLETLTCKQTLKLLFGIHIKYNVIVVIILRIETYRRGDKNICQSNKIDK